MIISITMISSTVWAKFMSQKQVVHKLLSPEILN